MTAAELRSHAWFFYAVLAFWLSACGGDPQPAATPGGAGGGGNAAVDTAGAPPTSGGSAAGSAGSAVSAGGAASGAAGSATGGGGASVWWNQDFGHRCRIDIDNASGTEALEAVPVLVKLDAAFGYAGAAADGHDLRFVDASGTLLSHDIDTWLPGGESSVWVKLEALAGPGSASLYAYWGNAAAEVLPAAHGHAVWSAGYAGVWHFADSGKDATGQHDSTSANAAFVAGQHGKAVSFDGATQYFNLPGDTSYISGLAAVTFSGWVKHSGTQPDGKGIIIGIGTEVATGHASWSSVTYSGDNGIIGEANPDETIRGEGPSGAGSFPNDQWSYFTVVVDIAGKKISNYKNGAPVGDVYQGQWAAAAFKDLPSNRAAIGAEEDKGPHWFQGALDEIRLEQGARSAAWIAAQGHAVTGDWLSFGPEETRP